MLAFITELHLQPFQIDKDFSIKFPISSSANRSSSTAWFLILVWLFSCWSLLPVILLYFRIKVVVHCHYFHCCLIHNLIIQWTVLHLMMFFINSKFIICRLSALSAAFCMSFEGCSSNSATLILIVNIFSLKCHLTVNFNDLIVVSCWASIHFTLFIYYRL